MKVSVIIPTYKPQDYLWTCLDSLKSQTFPKEDFELIIILNGCNEPYYSLIKNYIASDLREINTILIQTDTGGVSNARNIGIERARGEYITFIDDDDYVSASYLKSLFDSSAEGHVSISNLLNFNDGENVFFKSSISANYDRIKDKDLCSIEEARSYFSGPVAKLFHRDVIGNRRFNLRFTIGEDTLFNFTVSNKIRKVKPTSPDAIYYRRVRPNSANFRRQSLFSLIKTMSKSIFEYTKLMLLHPFQYNFYFYISRCGGAIFGVYSSYMTRKKANNGN